MTIANDDTAIRALYQDLLDAWNQRNAADFAALFAEDGSIVGFDGSPVNSRAEIEAHLSAIFADHTPATYVSKVREVRFLSADAALLRGVAGMVPPGASDLKPENNAIQSLMITRRNGQWHIAMYQNTPARFDGRPELAQQLTDELRELLKQ